MIERKIFRITASGHVLMVEADSVEEALIKGKEAFHQWAPTNATPVVHSVEMVPFAFYRDEDVK